MTSAGGLVMLVAQAKRAAELFTGSEIPDERIEAIAAKLMRMTLNIVLIGMPGCGKTSIGAALAKRMGRGFADVDTIIEELAGKPIAKIFEDDGEDEFRKLESKALEYSCKQSGLVIATGGGVVNRLRNLDVMRQNGTIVFLDRALEDLDCEGRPVSLRDGVEALAAVRLPIYREWSDHIVSVRGIDKTAADIRNILEAL